MDEVSQRTKGARRCTNPNCEYGGRWLVRTMTRLKNDRWMCLGRGCHSVYEARDVIDPESEDYRIYVGSCRA